MKNIKEILINKIIDELESENVENIPFLVAPLYQSLDKFSDMLEDLRNHNDWYVRYNCCGHGCDWSAPSFLITKTTKLGNYSWNGDEHDFWDFEDRFNNVDEVEKKELKKQAEIKRLKKQIEYYNNKLNEIENTNRRIYEGLCY